MADPYRNLTPAQRSMTPLARVLDGTYQLVPYDPSSNRGLYEDGHRLLFDAMVADLAALAGQAAHDAARAEAGAGQTSAWLEETSGAVSRLSDTTFRVAGVDMTARYVAGRAVLLDQTTDAFGYVSDSAYSGGNTTVVVSGCVVDAGLTRAFYGQDPRNAPEPSSVGADLYLYNEMTSLGW